MELFVVTVYDKATAQYGNPFNVVSKGQALRSFGDEVAKAEPGNQLNAHPDDFELYFLGLYDTETGLFTTAQPERIAQGSDFVRK